MSKYVLYHIPGSCSVHPHIALEYSGLPYELERVQIAEGKHTLQSDGSDFGAINPKKKVPALKTPDGDVITEGAVIDQYIADQVPEKHLAPKHGTMDRYRLEQMLVFLSTEVHKQFPPLLMKLDEESQKRSREALNKAFAHLASHLEGGKKVLFGDTLTVADAYAYNMLRWSRKADLGVLEKYENLKKFFDSMEQEPAVKEVLKQEGLN
eukprot:gb/GECG01008742.1/.p1 GENE.gb/GECG01008742.1/~~gb/GECG01008742.1/.p1  ORF type:complete len:209 (+),score=39.59 gb/GECG01008742.1/:1-627(+)